MLSSRVHLTLAAIEAFDPDGPPTRRLCPLCGKDKPRDSAHRSLSLDRATGLWKCFRCGEGGKVEEKWEERSQNHALQRARRNLRATFSLSVGTEVTNITNVQQTTSDIPAITPLPDSGDLLLSAPIAQSSATEEALQINRNKSKHGSDSIGREATTIPWDWMGAWENSVGIDGTRGEKYMLGRAISVSAVSHAGIRFCSSWSGRASVVFPIYNRAGEMVAVQGRAVKGNEKRTFGPKKEGAFFAPIQIGERRFEPLEPSVPAIILVEAPIDALSLASCGFPALALCGTTGPSWLHIACGLRRVLLAFDADDAGDEAAKKLASGLERFGADCERLRPQGAKDWNELLQNSGKETFEEIVAPIYSQL